MTFLFIDAGSQSTWTIFARRANFEVLLPVTRSLKRTPSARRRSCRVGFLKSVGAYLVKRNLTADEHHRNAVHVRSAKSGDRVRKPRAARHYDDRRPPACAGVAIGHVDASLLVAAEDKLERRARELVEDVYDVAARISEDKLRPDPFKGLYKRTRAGSLLRLQISRSGRIPRRGPSSPWRSS